MNLIHGATFLAVLSLPMAGQTLSFLAPVSTQIAGYSAATTLCSMCLAVADFDGDGKPDIAYAAVVFTPAAGVLLRNGDGSFRSSHLNGLNPVSRVIAADFDGDGKADVLFSGSVTWIYLGNGDGTFNASPTVTACANVVAAADVNGDGKLDLICGASIFLGNGDGTFGSTPRTLPGNALLVADFNRDGKPDALVTSGSGLLEIALGHGDGTFGVGLAVANPLNLQTILAADFNGDQRLDLVGVSKDGATFGTTIAVLPGNGDGTFGTAITTAGATGALTAAADLNGDGKLDLVAGDAVLAGNGDGTFRFPVFIGVATGPCSEPFAVFSGNPCGYNHTATVIADFDGDKLPDLAAGYDMQGISGRTSSWLSILVNDAPGDGFTVTGVSSASGTWPVAPGSFVSAFGVNLASQTAWASTNPSPTTLGGIRLHVRYQSQTNDILAPLLYVSPTQINYVLPAADPYVVEPGIIQSHENPYAWVDVERVGSAYVKHGVSVPLSDIAPGLFVMGAGLAAGNAERITVYAEVTAPLSVCAGPVCSSNPIDLTAGPVYLSLYGTGFSAAVTGKSSCSVDGKALPATYAGPELAIAGLDQINLLLPISLAGAGEVPVTCSFGSGAVSNAVRVNIR